VFNSGKYLIDILDNSSNSFHVVSGMESSEFPKPVRAGVSGIPKTSFPKQPDKKHDKVKVRDDLGLII
jgi:hypothetical protein